MQNLSTTYLKIRTKLSELLGKTLFEDIHRTSDQHFNYLAVGASDVLGIGSYPKCYPKYLAESIEKEINKPVKIYQSAILGSSIPEIYEYLKKNIEKSKTDFDLVTILVGYNDGVDNLDPEIFAEYLEKTIQLAKNNSKIVIVTNMRDLGKITLKGPAWFAERFLEKKPLSQLMPQYNEIIHNLADKYECLVANVFKDYVGVYHNDLAFDFFHPNRQGYFELAQVFMKALNQSNFKDKHKPGAAA